MPWPYLPADFDAKYDSAWVWLPNSLYDPVKGHELYTEYINTLAYAETLGFDGVCVNEHHQNAYGLMPSPNVVAGALTQRTTRCKIAVIGNALPLYNPPLRVAEEFAMLDVMSGGRLVAGMVVGGGPEYFTYSIDPTQARERFREALDLIVKAWTEPGPFMWDSKHYHFRYVNPWPRPLQQPHPPIWIPGSGISSTAEYVVSHDYCFCHLSYHGAKNATFTADRYWELAAKKGRDDNPHRYSFLQLIGVAETDAQAEELYAPHAEYFFRKLLHTPSYYQQIPGCLEYPALVQALTNNPRGGFNLREMKARDFYDNGFVIVGSAKTVREQLVEHMKRLRVGHLLTLLHFGSMSTELCKRNIDLFARDVLPHLESLWSEYDDRWWPERLKAKTRSPAMAAAE
jgi:alkanesulfonate monooxygenase SsuD/methylene tetrahydromethanopterin reductase-like flavin-dependent oxidoreductase (luciferase family)